MADRGKVQARLYVVMARNADKAVILLQGTEWNWQMWLWDTKTDEFTPGQWFRGGVEVGNCDISRDGKYVVLGLYKEIRRFGAKRGGPHTVVSRPPYFSALAYFPGTYGQKQGGYFLFDESVILYQLKRYEKPRINEGCPWKFEEDRTARLDQTWGRRGWRVTSYDSWAGLGLPRPVKKMLYRLLNRGEAIEELADAGVELKATTGRGEVELGVTIRWEGAQRVAQYIMRLGHVEAGLGEVDWAGFDHRGRCICTRDGRILEASFDGDKLVEHQLADLSKSTFEKVPPPDWALEW